MASGTIKPPTRAFMDDMTITAKSYIEGRWMPAGYWRNHPMGQNKVLI